MIVHTDCRYFAGDRPCKPHKAEGVHCGDCTYYQPRGASYCILKLGAIGDVLRTTPLLRRIRQEDPAARITWLTLTPEVLPSDVDRPLGLTPAGILELEETGFDFLFNLDKDPEACALANRIRARVKKGFCWKDGVCAPIDENARHKWLTGLFDDLNRENTKSYPEEIFEICGYRFEGEHYLLELQEIGTWTGLPAARPLVGLNTGCGVRWATRLWPESHWVELARRLADAGYGVLLLGGDQEDEKNRRIAQRSGAVYPGTFSLPRFFDLMNQCDLVVTAVSMALHVALGLGKRLVLLNNVFNRNEFELYGLGSILEPEGYTCTGCFKNTCADACMAAIPPEAVLGAVEAQLSAKVD